MVKDSIILRASESALFTGYDMEFVVICLKHYSKVKEKRPDDLKRLFIESTSLLRLSTLLAGSPTPSISSDKSSDHFLTMEP